MRVGGAAAEAEAAGLALSRVERSEAALVLEGRTRAVREQELHHLVISHEGRAVERRLAAAVHGVDVDAAVEAHLDRVDRIGFSFLTADGVFFLRSEAC